jgi:HEAT repeat protein
MSNDAALSRLVAAIDANDDPTAERIVLALPPEDEAVLLTWLARLNPDYRWWAARALAHIGSPAAAQSLVHLLMDDLPAVRAATAFALAHLYRRAPDAVRPYLPAIASHLSDADGTVRQASADALAFCGVDAIPPLAAVLEGADEGARTRAAYALRKMASLASAPLLFRCLNDPNFMVHTYAHEALDELGLLDNLLLVP